MFLVYKDRIVEYKVSDDEARALLRADDYEYACFLYSDPQIVLFPLAGTKRARLINDIAHDYTWLPEVPTTILHVSPKSLAMAKGHPMASLCRIGFPPQPKPWSESRGGKELRDLFGKLSELTIKQRVLFYGALDQAQWAGDPRIPTRQRQVAFCKKIGLEVVHVKVEPTQEKKLLDFMIENECFAALGMDGDCFSCFRDVEQALALAPVIRITESMESIPFVNQWGTSWAIPEDDPNATAGKAIGEIKRGCSDGSILVRLNEGKELVEAAHRRPYFFACLDSLTLDPEFTIGLIKRFADDEDQEGLISAARERAKKVDGRCSWDADRLAATDWKGNQRFAKCRLGEGKKSLIEEWHLGAALEPAKVPFETKGQPELSFIVPCMGRLAHLRKAMDGLLAQGQEVVVVDWSCPDKCGDWAEGFPGVKVVRIPGQRTFNLSKARNAGARVARGERLCFLDCDMVLNPDFAGEIIRAMPLGCFATFGDSRNGGYAGMTTCYEEDFRSVGGYDERMEGWGWEDTDFKKRLLRTGLEESLVDKSLAWHIVHGDDDRMRFYKEKDWTKSHDRNVSLSESPFQPRPLRFAERAAVGTYMVRHRDWSGFIRLNEDGSMVGGNDKPNGEWRIVRRGELILDWKYWNAEKITPSGLGKFRSDVMEMEKLSSPDLWDPNGVWVSCAGGLGDRLCILSAARTYARLNPKKKVFCTDFGLAEVMAVDNLVRLGIGGAGKLHCWLDSPGRNWLDKFHNSMGLPWIPQPPLPDLPEVPPLDGLSPGTYIALQPRGTAAKPDLPEGTLRALVKECIAEKLRVIIVGKEDTPRFLEGVEYFTADDVLRLLRIVGHAKAAMTPDSASAHIAAGYGIPMLVWVPEDKEGNVLYPVPGNEVIFPTIKPEEAVSAIKRILKREHQGFRHTSIHLVDTNIGDMVCAPWRWFPLSPSKVVDIMSVQQNWKRPEGKIIVGGGGLLYFKDEMRRIIGNGKGVVVWGIGMNSEGSKNDSLPQWISSCDLVGIRDWIPGWRWVPCPSCMSPLFDEKWKTKYDIVIYEHKDRRIPMEGFPKMSNNVKTMREAILFLASGEAIITNTYHGAYWATLLGKKVVLWEPWSSRFLHTKYKYPFCQAGDWRTALKNARNEIGSLEETREANVKFYEDLRLSF